VTGLCLLASMYSVAITMATPTFVECRDCDSPAISLPIVLEFFCFARFRERASACQRTERSNGLGHD